MKFIVSCNRTRAMTFHTVTESDLMGLTVFGRVQRISEYLVNGASTQHTCNNNQQISPYDWFNFH